jgi:hypothetical protein
MPNAPHQIAVTLLSEQPHLLSLLSELVLGKRLPSDLALTDSTLRLGDPAEVRPDLVLTGGSGWVLGEVQGEPDDDKAWRWPLAMAIKTDQTRLPGDLVVLTFNRAVAAWAKRVGRHRGSLGTTFSVKPVVLLVDGAVVERLLDERHPELAFFAAWAMQERHGREARATVLRALELSQNLPEPRQAPMRRAIYDVLSERMLAFLKEAAMNVDQIPEGPAMRLFRLEAFAEGEAKGKAEGRVEGEAKGRVEGKAEALLAVLAARALPIRDDQRQLLLGCSDGVRLDGYLRRAISVASVDELLG